MYYKKIVGDRIYLSPRGNSEEEINKYTLWMNDFKVTDFTGRSGELINLESEKNYLGKPLKDKTFSIITIKDDKLIGTVGLMDIDNINRSAELGIFIGEEEYRSNGYGSEAIKLILDYGFNYLNLHRIYLNLLSANERAHKCYIKCGFKDAGREREAVYLNGKYYDGILMDILKGEFEKEYIRNKCVK